MNMRTYKEYLERIEHINKLYEQALSKEKKIKIKRFREVGDFKSILKELNILIEKIKTEIINVDYNNIEYKRNKKDIVIHYNDELLILLNTLNEILIKDWEDDNIMNKIFQDGYRDIFLHIELHGIFNQIHIMNGLPNFIKNIGLGYKIYKKMIRDFNYLSSFYGVEPSIDSDMTWDSILNDKEIYSFTNDDNIICFWYETEYEKIINKLKEFFKYDGDIRVDDDFLNNNNITDDDFLKIIRTLATKPSLSKM